MTLVTLVTRIARKTLDVLLLLLIVGRARHRGPGPDPAHDHRRHDLRGRRRVDGADHPARIGRPRGARHPGRSSSPATSSASRPGSSTPSSPTASPAWSSCPTAVYLETKGDANETADPSLVPAKDVIGKVTVAVPYAGFGIALLSTYQGVMFLIAFGMVLLASAWLLETVEDEQRESMRRRARQRARRVRARVVGRAAGRRLTVRATDSP